MSFVGIVEKGVIKLSIPVPEGTQVEVIVPEETSKDVAQAGYFARRYAEYVGAADSLPEDFAVNHDHYLHGAPKQA